MRRFLAIAFLLLLSFPAWAGWDSGWGDYWYLSGGKLVPRYSIDLTTTESDTIKTKWIKSLSGAAINFQTTDSVKLKLLTSAGNNSIAIRAADTLKLALLKSNSANALTLFASDTLKNTLQRTSQLYSMSGAAITVAAADTLKTTLQKAATIHGTAGKLTLAAGDTLVAQKYFKMGKTSIDSATGRILTDSLKVEQGIVVDSGKAVTFIDGMGASSGTMYGNSGYGVLYCSGSFMPAYITVSTNGTLLSLIKTGRDSFAVGATADTIKGLTGVTAAMRAQITPQGTTTWTSCPAAVVKAETLIVTCLAADTAAARATGYFWEIK